MPLTALAIKQARPDKTRALKLYDGGGLYLLLLPRPTPSSPKRAYWRLKYRFAGKEKLLALGVAGEGDDGSITLAKAREKRDAAKKLLEQGLDPSADRREKKRLLEYKAAMTFEAIAREVSAAMIAASSSGVVPVGSTPRRISFSRSSEVRSAATIRRDQRSITRAVGADHQGIRVHRGVTRSTPKVAHRVGRNAGTRWLCEKCRPVCGNSEGRGMVVRRCFAGASQKRGGWTYLASLIAPSR